MSWVADSGHGGSPGAAPDDRRDVPEVLQLNADHVELLSPLDAARLDALRGWASRADVIECDGQTAGFVLVFGPGTDYDSDNYRWFGDRFGTASTTSTASSSTTGSAGVGWPRRSTTPSRQAAAPRERLVLEVNIDPPTNRPSPSTARTGLSRGHPARESGAPGQPDGQGYLQQKHESNRDLTRVMVR